MQVTSATSLFAAEPAKPAQSGFFVGPEKAASEVKKELLEYTRMTPAEKIRKDILDAMGLKEEDLKGLDPKLRETIENRIKEAIKMKVEASQEQQTGFYIDIKA
ncbi:hypothetical protein [Phenylobacterium sp.]|uniref:hypothetical protein n=1 Tax=Phenylobacterium sp. TaxID=1871053 RepID=UPI00286D505E|nr:hypothetical protein [Phenylobacterium sp.]